MTHYRPSLAERVFRGEVDVSRNDMTAIVESADDDWRGVARQIADWAADTLASTRR